MESFGIANIEIAVKEMVNVRGKLLTTCASTSCVPLQIHSNIAAYVGVCCLYMCAPH